MQRITKQDLEGLINMISSRAKGKYYVSYQCGGASLRQLLNESGGTSDVFRCGHIAKRDLYRRMEAFIDGLDCEKK